MIAVQTNYPRQILAFWKANIIKIIGLKKEYLLLINNLSLTFEQSLLLYVLQTMFSCTERTLSWHEKCQQCNLMSILLTIKYH